ncbi:DUF3598 family protein [Chamaesiphon minutus]|uniref:Uncharacterized protein n=1 Tax=Chamaesiphon minutus (strain ATCC 27169 / PCC 6605) TaxID=1173020 RepID=K9ULE1_CHAP6|nr:DUF3598 family protein [Chamaesiphon minutus]AFY95014.1 protein of unknown function (DUF3598) [Chamaesiphon minutus PCC 6605]
MVRSQWECVLQNLGEWQGSFTRLSPVGEEIEDIPSLISLTGVDENRSIHLSLTRYYPDPEGILQPQEMAFDFSAPSAGAMFFETGAFSEGSPYLRKGLPGGAEFAFRHEDRRLRLIPQYDGDGQLFRLTLIREARVGTNAPERPPLDLAGWLGVWQGEAVTLYLGSTQASELSTLQTVEMRDDRTVTVSRTIGSQVTESTLTTDSASTPTCLTNQSTQVILLADAAYVLCPTQIEPGVATELEVGWSISQNLRQRLIRTYTDRGDWLSLTFITESRSG